MMIRSLLRTAYGISRHQLTWREKNNMLEFFVYDPEEHGKILYIVDTEVTFPELKQRPMFQQYEFTLPSGVDETLPVATLLTRQQRPIQIKVSAYGQQYVISNRNAKTDQSSILETLGSNDSVYSKINDVQTINEHRTILTGLYLRLEAEAYLKNMKVNSKATFTPELKEQTLSYLGTINQISAQSELFRLKTKQDAIESKIQDTQRMINGMEEEADKLLRLYKLGVIGLTSAHLFGFGYMIFGVEWLGWDIIEPLTYSVMCLYTFFGMRFYRKFQKDRTQQTIKEALRRWAMRPSKRIALNELKKKLLHEQRQFTQLSQKIRLINNRLNPLSTLPVDL